MLQINESLFYAALSGARLLNDSGLKRNPFELRYLESDVPGSGGEVAAVVTATVCHRRSKIDLYAGQKLTHA